MNAQELDAADAAQAAAVRAMLAPASIAIIGASDKSRWSINVVERELAGSAAFVGHVEDLPEHLVGPCLFARQHFHALDVRRLDRKKAE